MLYWRCSNFVCCLRKECINLKYLLLIIRVTVRDAIRDLPAVESGMSVHVTPSKISHLYVYTGT